MSFLSRVIGRKPAAPEEEFDADPVQDEAEHAEETSYVDAADIREDLNGYLNDADYGDEEFADEADAPPAEPEEDEEVIVKIWEMVKDDDEATAEFDADHGDDDEVSQHDLAREAMKSMNAPIPAEMPSVAPDMARPKSRPNHKTGRQKTRMLGFHSPEVATPDVFDMTETNDEPSESDSFPVGWLVVIDGPGRGASFTLHNGVTTLGRGKEQKVRLDFGDDSISRENHAVIAYDEDMRAFFIGHGGKSNLVRLNGRPVLSTEDLSSQDLIRIGETTLRFVGFCSPEFDWDEGDDDEALHARVG